MAPLLAVVLSLASCTGGPDDKQVDESEPNAPEIADVCEILEPALVDLGGFDKPEFGEDDAEYCVRVDGDDREVRLAVTNSSYDSPNLGKNESEGDGVREITVNGRKASTWWQRNEGHSPSCVVVLNVGKNKSVFVVAVMEGDADERCDLSEKVAKKVEPELPPEQG